MNQPVTARWTPVSVVPDGSPVDILDVDVWQHDWVRDRGRIIVAHASSPDTRHTLPIYRIDTGAGPVRFAAGELSAGVWVFSVPAPA